jgi:hypothetical protein
LLLRAGGASPLFSEHSLVPSSEFDDGDEEELIFEAAVDEGVGDADEATARLLMLIADHTARVDEVLKAAAACYSARVLQHARAGDGDTVSLSALGMEARTALSAFLAKPAVASELQGVRSERRRSLLKLLEASDQAGSGEAPSPGTSASARGGEVLVGAGSLLAGARSDEEEEGAEAPVAAAEATETQAEEAASEDDTFGEACNAAPAQATSSPVTLLSLSELGWTPVGEEAVPTNELKGRIAPQGLGKEAACWSDDDLDDNTTSSLHHLGLGVGRDGESVHNHVAHTPIIPGAHGHGETLPPWLRQ